MVNDFSRWLYVDFTDGPIRDNHRWDLVKSFTELSEYLKKTNNISLISIAHDFTAEHAQDYKLVNGFNTTRLNYESYDEPTGLQMLEYIIHIFELKNQILPSMNCHELNNKIGAMNIINKINEYFVLNNINKTCSKTPL